MEKFNFDNNKVVGYVEYFWNTNAYIGVIGYLNSRNEFHRLTEPESLQLFHPKGRIFAHNFESRYYELKGEIVCLSVKPNEKEGDYLDDFIWDKAEDVYKYGYKIHSLQGTINDNGEHNYNILIKNNLIEQDTESFVYSEGKVYHIEANNQRRIVPYWNENSLNLIQIHDKKFIIGYTLPPYDGEIDITTDNQLIDWFINKILKKEWNEILKKQNFKFIEPYIKEVLSSLKEYDPSIMRNRMERLKVINSNFDLTLEELQQISKLPWLSTAIEKSMAKYKEEYKALIVKQNTIEFNQIKAEHEALIQEEKRQLDKKLNTMTEEFQAHINSLKKQETEVLTSIDNKKLDLEILDESIKQKNEMVATWNAKLNKIEERKTSIIEDFTVVKDVLEAADHTRNSTLKDVPSHTFALEHIELVDNEGTEYQTYIMSLQKNFIRNNIPHSEVPTIANQIAEYNILLVPDVAIAKAIIIASQKCSYMTEYVNANWKSFNDLWDNGLGYIIGQCYNNKDLMHFLILQNINLTYLPNYMQPIIDLQSGVIDKLPNYGVSFPSNLRIICTITEDEVIPLSTKCLKYIGCIDPNAFKKVYYQKIIPVPDNILGYLSPEKLVEAKKNIKDVPNFFKEYVDE